MTSSRHTTSVEPGRRAGTGRRWPRTPCEAVRVARGCPRASALPSMTIARSGSQPRRAVTPPAPPPASTSQPRTAGAGAAERGRDERGLAAEPPVVGVGLEQPFARSRRRRPRRRRRPPAWDARGACPLDRCARSAAWRAPSRRRRARRDRGALVVAPLDRDLLHRDAERAARRRSPRRPTRTRPRGSAGGSSAHTSVRRDLGAALGVDDAGRDRRLHAVGCRRGRALRGRAALGPDERGAGEVAGADREDRAARRGRAGSAGALRAGWRGRGRRSRRTARSWRGARP